MTHQAHRGGQHQRPFNPHSVDNPSLEVDIRQQEHHKLLEGHPLDDDPSPTHTGCKGESRPQGLEEKGLEDPGLVCQNNKGLEDPGLESQNHRDLADPGLTFQNNKGL